MFVHGVRSVARQSGRVTKSLTGTRLVVNLLPTLNIDQSRNIHSTRVAEKRRRDGHGGYTEPEYQVDFNPTVNPDEIFLPFIPEEVRQDIYAKFVTDSNKWSIQVLAQNHSANASRIQSIILLLHQRYTMMKNMGLKVEISGNKGSTRHAVRVAVPNQWQNFYEAHLKNPETTIAELLKDYNQRAEAASEAKADFNEERLKEILTIVKDHYRRLKNVEDHEEHMKEMISTFAKTGVDPHFRETLGSEKKENPKDDSYFPDLLGDDDYEVGKNALLKRIKEETKAKFKIGTEHYDSHYSAVPVEKNVVGAGDKDSRWKFAFKDTSAKPDSIHNVVSTVIRTRQGKLRTATPIEESQRSWNKRLSYLDVAFHQSVTNFKETYFQKFHDFDKDDHLTNDIAKEKREKQAAASEKK